MKDFIKVFVQNTSTHYGYNSKADVAKISISSIECIRFRKYSTDHFSGCSISVSTKSGNKYDLTNSEKDENRGYWKSREDVEKYVENLFKEDKQL